MTRTYDDEIRHDWVFKDTHIGNIMVVPLIETKEAHKKENCVMSWCNANFEMI